jgi:hypothetical protein
MVEAVQGLEQQIGVAADAVGDVPCRGVSPPIDTVGHFTPSAGHAGQLPDS